MTDPRLTLRRVEHRRSVASWNEQAILNRADQLAVLRARHALNLGPFLVRHELRPRGALRRLVRPREQIDELGSPIRLRFPHRDDIEAVFAHDARSMIAEALVECRLVVLENLVDAQLMDHDRCLPYSQTTLDLDFDA